MFAYLIFLFLSLLLYEVKGRLNRVAVSIVLKSESDMTKFEQSLLI